MRRQLAYFLAGLTLTAASGTATAQSVGEEVATATVAQNLVRASLPGAQPAALSAGQRVAFGAALVTGPLSANVDRFDDGTTLTLGADAQATIDQFAYNPATNAGEMAVNLSRGLARFVTGRMASSSYNIRTPVSIIGVRGTTFVLSYQAGVGSTIYVEEGETSFANIAGQSVNVPAGFASTIPDDGGEPSPPAPPSPTQQAVVAALNVAVATVAPPALTVPTVAQSIAANAAAAEAAAAGEPATSTSDLGGSGSY